MEVKRPKLGISRYFILVGYETGWCFGCRGCVYEIVWRGSNCGGLQLADLSLIYQLGYITYLFQCPKTAVLGTAPMIAYFKIV